MTKKLHASFTFSQTKNRTELNLHFMRIENTASYVSSTHNRLFMNLSGEETGKAGQRHTTFYKYEVSTAEGSFLQTLHQSIKRDK